MKSKFCPRQALATLIFSFIFSHVSYASTSEGISAIREGDCVEALKVLTPHADSGDIEAQYLLGKIYSEGNRYCLDFRLDFERAAQWYLRAAKRGDPEAQHAIAAMYWDGLGIPSDKVRGFVWMQKSAAQGNSIDLLRLSRLYSQGEGVPIDRVLAYVYTAIVANTGNDRDSYDATLRNLAENMSPPQLREARKMTANWRTGNALPVTSKTGRMLPSVWYRKAAKTGDAQALYKLGMIYQNNLEGTFSKEKARYFLRAAAEKGHVGAQETLARMYKCGGCGAIDYVLSYLLSALSVRDKDAHAKREVHEMWEKALTPEQIEEAKSLISEWRIGARLPTKTRTGHLRKVNYAEVGVAKQENTPQVLKLFAAASEGDEQTFNRLIETIPNINDYVVGSNMLLHELIIPAKSLRDDELQRQRRRDYRLTDEHMRKQRAIHNVTIQAKTRMLELALQRGASLKEGNWPLHASPLHLATVFGTREMVRLLLKYGADPNQYGGNNNNQQPIEFSLALSEHHIELPELIDPEQRAQIIVELLKAGAKMPYMNIDARRSRDSGQPRQPDERPAADYLIWDDLVSLTTGSEVLELMEKTGTTPFFATNKKSVLAHAVQAGNIGGVKWLKSRMSKDGSKKANADILTDAAMWAMYSSSSAASDILNELVGEDMSWNDVGPKRDEAGRHYKLLNLQEEPEQSSTLLGHAVLCGQYEWVTRLVELGASVDFAANGNSPLGLAVDAGDVDMVRLLLELGANPDRENIKMRLLHAAKSDLGGQANFHEKIQLLLNNRTKK